MDPKVAMLTYSTKSGDEMTDENVLYLSENKKETKSWFQSLGTQKLPLGGNRFGFIRSISQSADSVNKQFSVSGDDEVDSQGRKLSEGQIEYFKDSTVRDKNGKLKVVYHGIKKKTIIS